MKKIIKPNLFIIGAMKSGTTYLHDLLSEHPDIYMSKIKEPCFFVKNHELKKLAPSMWNMGICENQNKYNQLFGEVSNEKIVGESTTLYAKFPTLSGVPEKIHAFNPDARFIYVMRDPIERTLSHFWHNVRVESKMLDIYEGIKSDPHYMNVSHYALQIKEYLKVFDKSQFFFCTFENMIKDPEGMLYTIFDWLGVNAAFKIPNMDQPKNVTPKAISVSRHELLPYKVRNIKPIRKLIDMIPYSFWNALNKPNTRKVNKLSVTVNRITQYLRPIQQEQTEELKALLEMDYPEWKSLYPAIDT